jgi:hypothetical protein
MKFRARISGMLQRCTRVKKMATYLNNGVKCILGSIPVSGSFATIYL